MSDSDGDMGGLGSKTKRKETKSSQRRAGPSNSKSALKTNAKTKGKSVVETDAESSSVEEIVPEEQPKNQRGRRATVANTQTNGLQNAKERGKGRAAPEKASSRKPADIDVLDDTDADAVAESLVNAINKSNTRPAIRNDRETTHLRRQLEEAQDRISKLSKQLEELFKTRHTEPEKLLTELKDRFEAQLEAKTKTISNLSNTLAHQAPLFTNSSKLSAVELLTREKADEEKRLLDNSMNQLKQEITKKDEIIREKTQLEKELRFEINDLKSRPPPSNARSRPAQGILGPDEPKNVELIKFYEDLTNVIVPNIRQVKSSYLDLDEWALTCIYTYFNVGLDITHSLNFSLRLLYTVPPGENEPITSKDQLVRSVRYAPMELDKEPPDLVERLGYLATTFTFDHDQLPLFLSSMNEGLAKALVPSSNLGTEEDSQKSENEPVMVED